MKTKTSNLITKNKDVTTALVVPIAILMIPFIAMQFTSEVKWSVVDFITMGVLLIGTGLLIALTSRMIKDLKYRAVVIVVLLASLLLVWMELAVGIFGTPIAGS